ncbi:tetratricopeptide repeat protein [Pseudomonas salomonii]|uniref:PIN domain-containing protein n=1 Tax=Pseudomonas salomonii TaxID=191391 RepID=A0A1H3J9D3_9PSED|nr:hypothetical protein [Pseudomonas salomonii]SDY36522.1 hypothetical protein SAMN05216247_103504 [Pseudomonas salomonii]
MPSIWDLFKRRSKTELPSTVSADNSSVAIAGDNNGRVIYNDIDDIETALTRALVKQAAIINNSDVGELETEIDRQVNLYRDKMNSGAVNDALNLFNELLLHQAQNLTPLLIFRVKANIAICQHQLGKVDEAARLLHEACTYAPKDKRAVAYKVLAYILDENVDEALSYGAAELERNDDNELLAGFILQATRIKYQYSEEFVDPIHGFSEIVKKTKSVRLAHIHLLASREIQGWRELANLFLEENPTDSQAKNLVATGILHHYIQERQSPNGFSFTSKDIEQINLAAEYFNVEWAAFKASDRVANSGDFQNVQNLLILYKLSQNREMLRTECEYVLENMANNQAVIDTVVKCLLDFDENELCDEALKKITDREEARKLKFLSMVARKDWVGLNKFQDYSFSKFDGAFLQHAKIVVYIARAFKGQAKGKMDLENLLGNEKLDSRARLLLFEFAAESQIQSIAILAHDYGRTRINKDSDVIEFYHYMKLVRFLQGWKEIVSLLGSYPNIHENYDLVHMLALGYLNEYPIRTEAVAFYEKLKERYKGFEILLGIFHFKRKDYEAAKEFLHQYLIAGGKELYGLLVVCEIAKLERDKESLLRILTDNELEEFIGTAEQFMQAADYLVQAGMSAKGLTLAYDTYDANQNNHRVALAYFQVFLLANKEVLPDESATVGPGSYVKLLSSDGVVIERMVEISVHDDLALDIQSVDPYVRKVLGRSVGYEYEQSKLQGKIIWKVEEVKHRYHQAFHQVCNTFENRFPEEGGLWSIKMEEGNIQPLLDFVKGQAEQDEKFLATIVESNIPLEIAAGMWRKNIFHVVDLMRSTVGHIQTCLGTEEERIIAADCVQRFRGKSVVLDCYTAWVAVELGLLDALNQYFGEVIISQSTILIMQQLMGEFDGLSNSRMSIGWRHGVFTRSEYSESDLQAQRDLIALRIKDLQDKCVIKQYAFSSDLDELTEQLVSIKAEAIEPYFLAAETGALFVSEDAYSRGFSANIYKLKDSTWLQPIINILVHEGAISGDLYAQMILSLCHRQHNYVSVSSYVLENIFKKDESLNLQDFSALCGYIGGKNAEVESHYNLISGFILQHWIFDYNPTYNKTLERLLKKSHGDAFPSAKTMRATALLFDRLIKMPSGISTLNNLVGFPILRLRKFVIGWWKGHFYKNE